MSRKPRFSIILAAFALLAAAAVLVIMAGVDRSSPGEVAYASDPNAGDEAVGVVETGGLTTRAIDLPARQAECRGKTDQHYEDCVAVAQVLDALAGTSTARLTYFYSKTTGRVTKLKLQKKGLNGYIPAEIGSLAELSELWLYTNEITGAVPSEMGNLANLNWLFLADNKLSGQIPEALNKLTLDRLWLQKNDFTGCVPYNLTQTREYKVDRGLPACAPPTGDGTPTPVPTTPAGTPTPAPTAEPTATPGPPTSADVMRRIHCQPADFVAAFGEEYDLDGDATGLYYYSRNGRGLWGIYGTTWTSSSDSSRVVVCRTHVYDNISSAIFDNQYTMLAEAAAGSYDVLRQHKLRSVEDGLEYRGLLLRLGSSAVVTANEIVWQDTATRLAAVSSFRWDQVIVRIGVYDYDYYYDGAVDDMASSVESRFDDSIFDDIATRQQAGRGGGLPITEDSLYLAPPIDKP